MRILAISGSLRAASFNTAILEAMAKLTPEGTEIRLYPGISDLPHFNPDLDGETPPPSVLSLRKEIAQCQGLLISSPKYAHGVPGSLKNVLDWLVSSVEFPGKPVVLITAERATYARAQLREILTVMSARLIDSAFIRETGESEEEPGRL